MKILSIPIHFCKEIKSDWALCGWGGVRWGLQMRTTTWCWPTFEAVQTLMLRHRPKAHARRLCNSKLPIPDHAQVKVIWSRLHILMVRSHGIKVPVRCSVTRSIRWLRIMFMQPGDRSTTHKNLEALDNLCTRLVRFPPSSCEDPMAARPSIGQDNRI